MEGKPAGKAKVEIRIKGVKGKVLPEVNDEFAKELGLGGNLVRGRRKDKTGNKDTNREGKRECNRKCCGTKAHRVAPV